MFQHKVALPVITNKPVAHVIIGGKLRRIAFTEKAEFLNDELAQFKANPRLLAINLAVHG